MRVAAAATRRTATGTASTLVLPLSSSSLLFGQTAMKDNEITACADF